MASALEGLRPCQLYEYLCFKGVQHEGSLLTLFLACLVVDIKMPSDCRIRHDSYDAIDDQLVAMGKHQLT